MTTQKLSKLMSSKGGADEYYTPKYVVETILKYIPEDAVVWCPFDKEESKFVQLISEQNDVVYGHIDDGLDFFKYEPDNWDIMISNPPFTGKRKIFERALAFGKPFALLMTNAWLNDAAPKVIWPEYEKELQLLMFRNRVHFENQNGVINKKTNFSSSFFCSDFLPKQIVIKDM